MSQQLDCVIHFRHLPAECPRKKTTVRMIQMEDKEYFDDEDVSDDDNGNTSVFSTSSHTQTFQINKPEANSQDRSVYGSMSTENSFLSGSDQINNQHISELLMETVICLWE